VGEIVRFAPSPTGFLHVGGARTAIFNWLIARQAKGSFLLRIEDTDTKRSSDESLQHIISSMTWLGLNWDGEIVYQSKRLERHKDLVQNLLETNKAYRCFCSRDELQERRRIAGKQGETFQYDRRCFQLSSQQIEDNLRGGKPFSVRLLIPDADIRFEDKIHGPTVVKSHTLDDFIIQRMDGTPTYQMAVVADDHDMGVTLVLRGDDHLSNTPKQILIYNALEMPVPKFGHIPLILGPDKVRLSKRHGATAIDEFREMGILPGALFNYLCLLGWAPGDDTEVMSREEIQQRFDLKRINTSAAVFDRHKLLWINRKYLSAVSPDRLRGQVTDALEQRGYTVRPEESKKIDLLIELQKQRVYTIPELVESLSLYFKAPADYDPKGVRKFFNESGIGLLTGVRNLMEPVENGFFEDLDRIETNIRQFAERQNVSAGKVIHPLRLALTGKTESPGIFELIHILGKTKVIERIDNAIEYITK
jgi:glutamyl-tRNA synthetase